MMIQPKQINLRQLFSVRDVLNSKGFEILSEGDGNNLLISIPPSSWTNHNILFEAFNDDSSRTQILSRINDVNYVPTNINALNLVNHSDFIPDRNRYSTSFEWYIGELMIRRFSSFSSSYGVKVKNVLRNSAAHAQPGDYDAIAILRDINLIYFECKTGSFNTEKIFKCIERGISLHCEFSVMMVQNAISLNSLKACVRGIIHPLINGSHLNEISIKGNLLSQVYEWNNCFFVSATGNIEEQMRTIMRINAAKKSQLQFTFGLDEETYSKAGYVYRPIIH